MRRKKDKSGKEAKRIGAFFVVMVMVIATSMFIGVMGANNGSRNVNISEDSDELQDLLREYNVTEDRITVSGIEYTMDELLDLYRKYNITENDLKFAMNELPHYLEGAVLDSNIRIIVSETGEPSEGLKEGEDYDRIMSREEIRAISREAKERYIEKYGVDPGDTKIDVVNGIPFPVGEVKRLVERGEISGKDLADAKPLTVIATGDELSCGGPHAIDGKIYVHIFVATDDAHHPTDDIDNIIDDTTDALNRFETEFDVNMIELWYLNWWNASDVAEATSTSQVIDDLVDDTSWAVDENNSIVLGWAHDLDHNGMAHGNGFYAVCSDTAIGGLDWPHDSIVQHEISHLFDAPEGGTLCWEHPECTMNYCWAMSGTNQWCDNCRELVRDNINGLRILNDNGRARPPGTNVSQLKITISHDESVNSATIDLSPIKGPGFENVPMQLIFGDNKEGVWAATTNADYDPGVNKTYDLEVEFTTASGTYIVGCVPPLTVLRRGDVVRDNEVNMFDYLYIARYTVGLEPAPDELASGTIPADSHNGVNMLDAFYIARYTAHMESAP